MLSHHSEGSCPAPARGRFGLWSLLIPATKEKKTVGRSLEDCMLLQMLFPRCHDRLSTAAVNRKERRQKCPYHWIRNWPFFDRFAGTAGFQDPRASDRLHQANANLLCMRSWKHSVISSWASCVSVSSTESQWETLDDDPQSQRSTIWPCWVDVCHEGLVYSSPVAN